MTQIVPSALQVMISQTHECTDEKTDVGGFLTGMCEISSVQRQIERGNVVNRCKWETTLFSLAVVSNLPSARRGVFDSEDFIFNTDIAAFD